MRGEWSGGKGPVSRVSSFTNYQNSPLWYKNRLFLDDLREPHNAYLYDEDISLVDASGIVNWDVVRSYKEFVEYIEKNGIPDVVSFDNDLFPMDDPNISNDEMVTMMGMVDWENFRFKTGAHCAQYLRDVCKEKGVPIPKFYTHSANKRGREIIKEILTNV